MTIEQLEQRRAAQDPPDKALDARVDCARAATATLDETSASADADAAWLAHLAAWRETLVAELLAIKSPVRDRQLMGVKRSLELSIRCVDHGDGVFVATGWELLTSRLGQLMVASGFAPVGADAAANYAGRLEWRGSVKETEKRMKEAAKRGARAQQDLDDALMDDDERERRDARSKVLNETYNKMNVVVSASGGLRVVDRNYDDVDESTLTELQREALAHARAAFGATT